MTNCTITLDVTCFGYTYLLQLDAMLGDFLEDGDNAAAADTLHDWLAENARNFTDDARANGDTLAADIFSDMAAWDEGGNDPEEEPANEEPETITRTALSGHEYTDANIDLAEAVAERNGCPVILTADDDARELRATGTVAAIEDFFALCREAAANDGADDDAPENKTDAYDAVWQYLGCPDGDFLREILEEAAEDVRKDPRNLFKAGYFEGMARMLAAAIVNDGANKHESVATITRAAYDYCGLPW